MARRTDAALGADIERAAQALYAEKTEYGSRPRGVPRGRNFALGELVVGDNVRRSAVAAAYQEIRLSVHFSKELTVQDAFKTHAGARRVFAKFHLGGCSHCAISETETIEQVSEGYGIPLPMLMEELEKLFEAGGLNVGDRVRLPDEIRNKIPQLAAVPETGEVKSVEAGAYTVEFGDVRLQGLAEDFIKVETAGATA